jgi:hypothetical protein
MTLHIEFITLDMKFVLSSVTICRPNLSSQRFCSARQALLALSSLAFLQGCQMVSFQTKNPSFGKCWRALDWKMLTCFMAVWNILQTFGIFYDHLAHFVLIWYIFCRFG